MCEGGLLKLDFDNFFGCRVRWNTETSLIRDYICPASHIVLFQINQVQAKVWPCWRVLCNCGVAVRENDDVLVFDQCSGVPRVVQKSPGALAKGVTITRVGAAYKVSLTKTCFTLKLY